MRHLNISIPLCLAARIISPITRIPNPPPKPRAVHHTIPTGYTPEVGVRGTASTWSSLKPRTQVQPSHRDVIDSQRIRPLPELLHSPPRPSSRRFAVAACMYTRHAACLGGHQAGSKPDPDFTFTVPYGRIVWHHRGGFVGGFGVGVGVQCNGRTRARGGGRRGVAGCLGRLRVDWHIWPAHLAVI